MATQARELTKEVEIKVSGLSFWWVMSYFIVPN